MPGNTGDDYPDGTGVRIEPGSKIVMQMHYNSLTAGPQPDLTTIRLKTDASVAKEAKSQPWTNPQWLGGDAMMIPAATNDVAHSFEQPDAPHGRRGDPDPLARAPHARSGEDRAPLGPARGW